jgi:hypothetical protein
VQNSRKDAIILAGKQCMGFARKDVFSIRQSLLFMRQRTQNNTQTAPAAAVCDSDADGIRFLPERTYRSGGSFAGLY